MESPFEIPAQLGRSLWQLKPTAPCQPKPSHRVALRNKSMYTILNLLEEEQNTYIIIFKKLPYSILSVPVISAQREMHVCTHNTATVHQISSKSGYFQVRAYFDQLGDKHANKKHELMPWSDLRKIENIVSLKIEGDISWKIDFLCFFQTSYLLRKHFEKLWAFRKRK